VCGELPILGKSVIRHTQVAPHLHPGSIVVADNTASPMWNDGYKGYFRFIADPANRLRTMTLPVFGRF